MPNKIKDILNMDYNQIVEMSRKENLGKLRDTILTMSNTANRRIRELTKDEIGKYSPAYKILKDGGTTKFNVKDIDKLGHNELMERFGTLKRFLNAKSSTLSGWKRIRKNIGKRTGAKKLFANEYKSDRSAKIWINREKRFWKLYNRLVDNYGGIISQLNSDQIQSILSKIQLQRNQAKTDEDISKAITVLVDSLYKDSRFNVDKYLDALKDESAMEEVRIAYGKLSGH